MMAITACGRGDILRLSLYGRGVKREKQPKNGLFSDVFTYFLMRNWHPRDGHLQAADAFGAAGWGSCFPTHSQ
jgi:hypothetical protein